MISLNRDGVEEYMSVDEFSRWMCLAEALTFIERHAEDMGIDSYEMVKPQAIDTYIKERFHAMKYDVELEHAMGNI